VDELPIEIKAIELVSDREKKSFLIKKGGKKWN